MRVARASLVAAVVFLIAIASRPVATAPPPAPGYQQFLSPAAPLAIVAAKKADRLAWVAFEEGKRNAYTAIAPAFTPVRLTNFTKDDGIDMSMPSSLTKFVSRTGVNAGAAAVYAFRLPSSNATHA